MKFSIIPLFLLLALGALPGPAHAIPGLDLDVTYTLPQKGAPSSPGEESLSYGIGGDMFLGLPFFPFKIGARVGYDRFGAVVGKGQSSVTQIIPSVRYGFSLPSGALGIFGQAGVGQYTWSGDEGGGWKDKGYGVSLGLGASAGKLLVLPMYHRMLTGKGQSYFSINVGYKF
ncbi:MAG: hypothetical protein ACYC9O_04145 [Candidatus Latescibacterota bacterium]